MTPVFECPNGMAPSECLHLPNLPYRTQKFFTSLIKRQQPLTQDGQPILKRAISDHSTTKPMTSDLNAGHTLRRSSSADNAQIRSRSR